MSHEPQTAAPPSYSPGLEGIVAGLTAISEVDPIRDRLTYRGYDAVELARLSTYEEVAYLLLYGSLPLPDQLKKFQKQLRAARRISLDLTLLFKLFPRRSNPMDILRTAVSYLGTEHRADKISSHEENLSKAIQLVGQIPTLVSAGTRIALGQKPVAPDATLSHSSNFLTMMTGKKPDELSARIFDATMILYADHGFNASTFSARVTASTLSDLHSAITAAIGTLKGNLHGGANQQSARMILEIGKAERAESWILDALAQKKKIMGFGHRVYKNKDSRAPLLKELLKEFAVHAGGEKWCEIADIVETVMMREKKIFPNVDYPIGLIYYLLGIPIDLYTAIFAAARSAGWSAHVIEQLDNNRLIRPECHYTGPRNIPYAPLQERQPL